MAKLMAKLKTKQDVIALDNNKEIIEITLDRITNQLYTK